MGISHFTGFSITEWLLMALPDCLYFQVGFTHVLANGAVLIVSGVLCKKHSSLEIRLFAISKVTGGMPRGFVLGLVLFKIIINVFG